MSKKTKEHQPVKTKNDELDELIKNGPTKAYRPIKGESAKITEISPEQARYILINFNNKNLSNRDIAMQTARRYAADKTNGNWEYTGDTIRFSKNRDLLDGQHRLVSTILSGIPLRTVIVTGLNEESFVNMDSGKGRSLADTFHTMNIAKGSDAKTLSGAIRLFWRYNNDTSISNESCKSKGEIFSNNIGLKIYEGNKDIVKYLNKYEKASIKNKAAAAFFYYVFSKVGNKLEAEDYLDQIFLGANLEVDTIEYEVNRRIIKNNESRYNKMTRTVLFNIVIFGWNWRRKDGVGTPARLQVPTSSSLEIK